MRERTSALERKIEAMLMSRCKSLSSAQTIEFLLSRELISPTAARAFYVRECVEAMQQKGVPKVEAMELVAESTSCSVGTVRNYVYKH